MLFIHLSSNGWWEYDKEKNNVYNYHGGYHTVTEKAVETLETFECQNWHELYLAKHFCPLETNERCRNVWISPDGTFYEAESHELSAEYLCDIIYGIEPMFPGDELEKRGWVKAASSLMWEVRLDMWEDKNLTQKQQDALWDWCKRHGKTYPY